MIGRLALGAICLSILLGAPTSAYSDNGKLSRLQNQVAQANKREGVLTSKISAMNAHIRSLESDLSRTEAKLGQLQSDVAAHQAERDKVNALYLEQSRQLAFARHEYDVSEHHLARRLVEIYENPQTDSLALVLSSKSFSDAINRIEYLQSINDMDRQVAAQAKAMKIRWGILQRRTGRLLDRVEAETKAIADQAAAAQRERDRMASTSNQLVNERSGERSTLAKVRESKKAWLDDIAALEAGSAYISSTLSSSGSHSGATPSAAGLIWPVQGTITSPFGMRWGRMHEGLDIGAPEGTPIWAAAAGTVIYAGWEGGYGNLTVIDHGNGLATAYGHQSLLLVSTGQVVAQGQHIGNVGSTGHSTGPHLHFEVRVNGTPVDPLTYLP